MYIFRDIESRVYGLPQADIIANTQLCEKLVPYEYYNVAHVPGL